MGNFVGPLVAGALFDVNVEFPIYGNHSYVVRYRDYFVEKALQATRRRKHTTK